MKLTIKTFQNATFKVDIEPDKTVKDLKDTIEKEQGKDYPCHAQKLIYNGKILSDENKLAEYEFDEKKFIVLMITRPPPAPKPTPAAAHQPSSTVKQEPEEKVKQTKQPDGKTTSVSATPTSTTSTTSATSSSTTTATSTSTTPAQTRDDIQNPLQSLAGVQSAAAAALAEMSALSMGEPQISARLASLMSQPHFRQMQDLIQHSPHLLSSTIESLAASDPEMYNFISENPDIFVSALNHPPLAGLRSSDISGAQQRQLGGGGGGVGGMSQQSGGGLGVLGQQPAVDQLLGNVTEHDKEAIERLKELGFSEYLAVQAYMACDKDEQLAANLLFQMDQ